MNLPTPYSPAHLTLRTIYLWSSPCDSLALDATLFFGSWGRDVVLTLR